MVRSLPLRNDSPLEAKDVRTAVVIALQSWLTETPEQTKKKSTPGYFSVGMACKS